MMNTTELIFNGANLFVLPFWALMILLPRWSVTQNVIASKLPFVVLASLYVYLIAGTITGESAAALANPTLADIARFFSDERAAATGWVHFLMLDLFAGRWVYLEGQRTGVWTVHSLLFCLFAGPLGLLLHILTTWVAQGWRAKTSPEDAAAPSGS